MLTPRPRLYFMQSTYTQWFPQETMNGTLTTSWHVAWMGSRPSLSLLSNSEGNDFPIGSMVIKGEYLTQVSHARKKKGYVFEDYRPGQIVYHYKNLGIGTNLQLQTTPSKNSSKSLYFFLILCMRG